MQLLGSPWLPELCFNDIADGRKENKQAPARTEDLSISNLEAGMGWNGMYVPRMNVRVEET